MASNKKVATPESSAVNENTVQNSQKSNVEILDSSVEYGFSDLYDGGKSEVPLSFNIEISVNGIRSSIFVLPRLDLGDLGTKVGRGGLEMHNFGRFAARRVQ